MELTRRAFLKTATGVAITAVVTDPIGKVASFLDPSKEFYVAQVWLQTSALMEIVILHSSEHLAVGDYVVMKSNGMIRKMQSWDERIIGVTVAMTEDWKTA